MTTWLGADDGRIQRLAENVGFDRLGRTVLADLIWETASTSVEHLCPTWSDEDKGELCTSIVDQILDSINKEILEYESGEAQRELKYGWLVR